METYMKYSFVHGFYHSALFLCIHFVACIANLFFYYFFFEFLNFILFYFFWIFEFYFIFLYSRFLLIINFIHISVYMSISIDQFITPPSTPHCHFPPLVSISLFSTSVSQFLPYKPVHLYHFPRFHIYALIYNICFSLTYFTLYDSL